MFSYMEITYIPHCHSTKIVVVPLIQSLLNLLRSIPKCHIKHTSAKLTVRKFDNRMDRKQLQRSGGMLNLLSAGALCLLE